MPQQHREKSRPRTSSSSSESWPGSLNSRAERSRHAAKMRRDKEGVEIAALSKLLPYPEDITSRLDKGSIIRLTTSYLRMKKFSQNEGNALLEELNQKAITSGESTDDTSDNRDGALMLQALNGFVIFISRKGKIFYISENVGKHMGIHQYEMIGNTMMEFIHPDDQKELAKQFVVQVPGRQTFKGYGMENEGDAPTSMSFNCFETDKDDDEMPSITDFVQERQFFLRMRSVMSRRGSGGKGKVIGYRVVNFCGRLKLVASSSSKGYSVEGLICLCRPIQPQPILEVRMDGNMFMSRHSLDMCFTFCDPRIITLIGYEPHELVGKTVYQFHNPLDARKVSDCHSNLIVKGTSATKYYRFMGKNCSWVWLQTRATIIYNTNNVAQYIVCMNYVIGKDVGERHLMMEEMAKNKAVAELCGSVADSDCGESIASPSSDGAERFTPGCVDSPGTSGIGSGSEVDEPSQKHIKKEMEDFDVTLIPKAVRDHEQIMKPPAEQDISFASLLKMDNLKTMYGATEKMDTSERTEAPTNQKPERVKADASSFAFGKVNNFEGPFDDPIGHSSAEIQQSFQRATQNNIISDMPIPMQTFSPVSEACSETSSITVGSPPLAAALPSEGTDARMASVGEEDESLFKDLLELTKNDNMDNTLSQLNSDFPRMSFSVNSPSNLSQLLNCQSPGSVSLGVSSPESQGLVEDCIEDDDDVFKSKSESDNPTSSILAGLLAKPQPTVPEQASNGATSPATETPLNQGTMNYLSMSITKVDPMMSGAACQLPDDIANFSLEFCSPVMDQAACDAIAALGGDLYLPDSLEKNSNGGMGSATITEVSDLEETGLILDPSTEQGYSATSRTPVSVVSSPPVQNGILQDQTHLMHVNGTAPDSTPLNQEHLNVTERISQLDIKDSNKASLEDSGNAPILHALLLESRGSKPEEKGRRQRPPPLSNNGLNAVNDVLGPITPFTKAAVDAVDSLIQDFDEGSSADVALAPMNGNNNMVNQENLVLLQQLDKQRKIMAEEHRRQQQILMENQVKQQKMLEEQQRQLLQDQTLLSQVILPKQMQHKLQHQQQAALLAQQSSVGMQRHLIGPDSQGSNVAHSNQSFVQNLTEFAPHQTQTVSAALPVAGHHRQQQQMQQYSASPPQGIMGPFQVQQQQQQQQLLQQQQQQHGSPPLVGRSPPISSPAVMQQQYLMAQQLQQQQQQQMQQSNFCRQQQQGSRLPHEQANSNSLMFQNLQWGNVGDLVTPGQSNSLHNGSGRTLEQSDLDFSLANNHLIQHQ